MLAFFQMADLVDLRVLIATICQGPNITGATLYLINSLIVVGSGGSKSPWFGSEKLGGNLGRRENLMEKLSMETWRSLTYQRIGAITRECPGWWSPKGRPLKTKERHQQVYELEKKTL